MYKKIKWIILFALVGLLTLVFIRGLITSINISSLGRDERSFIDLSESESSVDKIESYNYREDDMFIIILGDSIGAGVGDDRGLGIGKGYAQLIENEGEEEVEVVNLAQPGAEISDMMKVLYSDEAIGIIGDADIVFISIGGNDLNHLRNSAFSVSTIEYEEALNGYIEDLGKTIDLIIENNSQTQIAVIGFYNPYGDEVPYEEREAIINWNNKTHLLVSLKPNSVYIPTYDLFKYNLEQYLYIDDFHPNADGYNAIVRRIYQVLKRE